MDSTPSTTEQATRPRRIPGAAVRRGALARPLCRDTSTDMVLGSAGLPAAGRPAETRRGRQRRLLKNIALAMALAGASGVLVAVGFASLLPYAD